MCGEAAIHTAGAKLSAELDGRIAFWRLLTQFVRLDSAAIRARTNSAKRRSKCFAESVSYIKGKRQKQT
jgi:hypothetical protein